MLNILSGRKKRRNKDALDARLAVLEQENAELLENAADIQRRFQNMARAVWRVEESERRRLARELHDNLGQVLTALRMKLEQLPESAERNDAVEMAVQSLNDVRNLSRLLRPPVLDDLGLKAAIEWLARHIREDAGLPVRVEYTLDAPLEEEVETLFFRIAQEALTNTLKYANATRAEIRLRRVADSIEMRVRDNGDGFDPQLLGADEMPAGVGLAGMRDRVSFFGGDLTINSAPGRGVVITAVLKLLEQKERQPE